MRLASIGSKHLPIGKEDYGEHDKITVAALKALCKVYKLDVTGLKNTLVDRLDARDGHQWKYGKPKAVKKYGKMVREARTKIGQMNAKGKVIQPQKPRTSLRYTAEVSSKIAK